jgi:hypothetical protein
MVARLISSEITAMAWASMLSCTGPDASGNALSSPDRPPLVPANGCRSPASPKLQSQADEGRFPAQQGWTAAGACLGFH